MTTNSSNTIKLTDTQLVALSAASQRPDRCIVPPEHLKGGAIAKFAGSLTAKGVAEEIDAAPGMPVVRRDADRTFSLVITAAGFAALGIEPQAEADAGAASDPSNALEDDGNGTQMGDGAVAPQNPDGGRSDETAASMRCSTPREGTKLAQVIALLERAEGATISDLTTATSWLAHTTRASLTGLRKRGYTVELDKGPKHKRAATGSRPCRSLRRQRDHHGFRQARSAQRRSDCRGDRAFARSRCFDAAPALARGDRQACRSRSQGRTAGQGARLCHPGGGLRGLSLAATKRLQAIAAAAGATTAAPHQQQANRERLIKAIVKARAWLDDLSTGRIVSVDGIAMREGKSARNIRMMIQLAFLDPSIIEAVVEGRLPATIGATEIVRDLPMAWTEQRAVLGV
jgi:hypothetical protein